MIPGTNKKIGDKVFLIPPLNFAALQKHKVFLARAMRGEINPTDANSDDLDVVFDLVYLALKRNYPTITPEDIAERLDFGNMTDVMGALMKTSGFEEAESTPGE